MLKSMTVSALSFAMLAVLAILPAPAQAGGKVWVANNGMDSNIFGDCGPFTNPCATFQKAHDNVGSGGEIGVLTPGDYGPLVIEKAISITNEGAGEAGVLGSAAGLTSVAIAAHVGDVVSLRGLVIDGQAIGGVGINIIQASAVHIQNCVIRNFEGSPGIGLLAQPNGLGSTQIFVSDSTIFNNGNTAASGGIVIQPEGFWKVNVVLDRVHVDNNVRGIWADGLQGSGDGVHLVLRHSVVSGNIGDGLRASSGSFGRVVRAPAYMLVERTSVVNNAGTGVNADGPGATMVLKDNTITHNGTGMSAANGGQLLSYGNNRNNNNIGAEGAPTPTNPPRSQM